MPNTIAFLRGMNLGRRRLTNDELKAAFQALGFPGVGIFRASGNVLFDAPSGEAPSATVARIEAGLPEQLGYPVPTIVRSADDMRRIVAFDGLPRKAVGAGKLQVMLLRDAPDGPARDQVQALSTSQDQLRLAGAELFWLPAEGISKSALDFKALDRLLGLTTTRTMGTMEGLLKRCDG